MTNGRSTIVASLPGAISWSMFLLSLGLLMLEVTLTRLLSVAMAYHFAVLSVSLAMLGLVFGGVFVHVAADRIARWGSRRTAGTAAVAAGAATVAGLLALLGLPLRPVPSLAGMMNLGLLFIPQLVPFLLFGVAVASLFAAYPGAVARLYLADLVGAGTGCVLVAVGLPILTGSGMVLAAAVAAVAAGYLLLGPHRDSAFPGLLDLRLWLVVLTSGVVLAATTGTFELAYVKGVPEEYVEQIRWTAHSRLSISTELFTLRPFGWGFGSRFEPQLPLYSHRRIRIDGLAETPILRWDGRPEDVAHLAWDVTMLPYRLRSGGRALIIGSGGGRDILSALTSGSWRVDAAEINEGIVGAVTTTYDDYGGHVYTSPGVTVQVRDGRSVLERAAPRSYDLVQLSAVDTWATGSVGSFALMENGLYTVEAFQAALRALAPNGMLAVSRFKYAGDEFGEVARMVAVALEALAAGDSAVAAPADHIVLAVNTPEFGPVDSGMATMLVSPSPISSETLRRVTDAAITRGFLLVWPNTGSHPEAGPVTRLLEAPTSAERERRYRESPIDIRPTRDDRPFFFNQTRLATLSRLGNDLGPLVRLRLSAYLTLVRLAIFLVVACGAIVVGPVLLARGAKRPRIGRGQLLYFAGLGVAFMLFEIPVIQKVTLGLGHPTYALAVVLAGLLIGAGLGSLLSGRISNRVAHWAHPALAAAAAALGIVLALTGDAMTRILFRLDTAPRLASAAGGCLVLGLVLGTLFPLGIRQLCAAGGESAIAWAWATNGAASVVASVVALVIGIELGMAWALGAGAAVYALCAAVAVVGWHGLDGGAEARP